MFNPNKSALAVVISLPKVILFEVKETIEPVTSQLFFDDVGWVYGGSEKLHTIPGGLQGDIGNLNLPAHFDLDKAITKGLDVLKSLGSNYKRTLLIITDQERNYAFKHEGIRVVVYAFGKCWQSWDCHDIEANVANLSFEDFQL